MWGGAKKLARKERKNAKKRAKEAQDFSVDYELNQEKGLGKDFNLHGKQLETYRQQLKTRIELQWLQHSVENSKRLYNLADKICLLKETIAHLRAGENSLTKIQKAHLGLASLQLKSLEVNDFSNIAKTLNASQTRENNADLGRSIHTLTNVAGSIEDFLAQIQSGTALYMVPNMHLDPGSADEAKIMKKYIKRAIKHYEKLVIQEKGAAEKAIYDRHLAKLKAAYDNVLSGPWAVAGGTGWGRRRRSPTGRTSSWWTNRPNQRTWGSTWWSRSTKLENYSDAGTAFEKWWVIWALDYLWQKTNMTPSQRRFRKWAAKIGAIWIGVWLWAKALGKAFGIFSKEKRGEALKRIGWTAALFIGANMATGRGPLQLFSELLNGWKLTKDGMNTFLGNAETNPDTTPEQHENVVAPMRTLKLLGKIPNAVLLNPTNPIITRSWSQAQLNIANLLAFYNSPAARNYLSQADITDAKQRLHNNILQVDRVITAWLTYSRMTKEVMENNPAKSYAEYYTERTIQTGVDEYQEDLRLTQLFTDDLAAYTWPHKDKLIEQAVELHTDGVEFRFEVHGGKPYLVSKGEMTQIDIAANGQMTVKSKTDALTTALPLSTTNPQAVLFVAHCINYAKTSKFKGQARYTERPFRVTNIGRDVEYFDGNEDTLNPLTRNIFGSTEIMSGSTMGWSRWAWMGNSLAKFAPEFNTTANKTIIAEYLNDHKIWKVWSSTTTEQPTWVSDVPTPTPPWTDVIDPTTDITLEQMTPGGTLNGWTKVYEMKEAWVQVGTYIALPRGVQSTRKTRKTKGDGMITFAWTKTANTIFMCAGSYTSTHIDDPSTTKKIVDGTAYENGVMIGDGTMDGWAGFLEIQPSWDFEIKTMVPRMPTPTTTWFQSKLVMANSRPTTRTWSTPTFYRMVIEKNDGSKGIIEMTASPNRIKDRLQKMSIKNALLLDTWWRDQSEWINNSGTTNTTISKDPWRSTEKFSNILEFHM